MGHSCEIDLRCTLTIPDLSFVLLFINRLWWRSSVSSCSTIFSFWFGSISFSFLFLTFTLFLLWLGCRFWGSTFNWNLLFFLPSFSHFYIKEGWDLVGIIAQDNSETGFGSWNILLVAFTLGDLVLRDSVWQSYKQVSAVIIIDCQGQVSNLVVECELLRHWELLTKFEEVWIVLECIFLSFFVEGIGHLDWGGIVIIHLELLDTEVGGHHSGIKSSSSSNTLQRVQGSLKFLHLEDFLGNIEDAWSTCGITNHLNELNLIRSKFGCSKSPLKKSLEFCNIVLVNLLKLLSVEFSIEILLVN